MEGGVARTLAPTKVQLEDRSTEWRFS